MNIIPDYTIEHIIAFLLVFIVFVLAYVLYVMFTVKARMQKAEVFSGLVEATQKLSALENTLDEQSQKIEHLLAITETHSKSLIKVPQPIIKRYNPFKESGVGGNQSFSAAFIDEQGNGVVITSLYSRDTTRISGKEVRSWETIDIQASPEEKEVLSSFKGNKN